MLSDDKKLREQEARLYRLFPGLRELDCIVSPLDQAPLDEIVALIDHAWERAFGRRIRIAYTPSFLRYCIGVHSFRGLAILARNGKGLQGTVLALPVDLRHERISLPAALSTGMCVADSWTGKGLVELLMVKQALALRDEGIRCAVYWRSAKALRVRDAGKRLAQATTASLYAKALDLGRTALHGRLSRTSRLGLWGRNAAYALRAGRCHLPDSCQAGPFLPEHAEAGLKLVNDAARGRVLWSSLSPEQLRWNCTFHEDGIEAAGWTLTQSGVMQAIAWGYRNPVTKGDAYFAMDSVVFSSEAGLPLRRAFMSFVERDIRKKLNCFAVMMPENIINEDLRQLGYLPVKTYYLGAADMGATPPLAPVHLDRLPVPLR